MAPACPGRITATTAIRSNRLISYPLDLSVQPNAVQIESAPRWERLIWIKGAISPPALAIGSGATVIQEGSAMPEKIDELLRAAKEIQKQAALSAPPAPPTA